MGGGIPGAGLGRKQRPRRSRVAVPATFRFRHMNGCSGLKMAPAPAGTRENPLNARRTTAGIAIVLAVPASLAACTKAPAKLTCTSAAAVARPVQGSQEHILVKSQSGARATTTAVFQKHSSATAAVTNAHGAVQMAVPVGNEPSTFTVKAVTVVVKGTQKATCSTTFIPAARKVSTPPPVNTPPANNPPAENPPPVSTPVQSAALTGAITPIWEGTPVGAVITKSPRACFNIHPRVGTGCGTFAVSVLISGFSGYGGIPDCTADPLNDFCTSNGGGSPSISGTLRLRWGLVCNPTGVLYDESQTMDLQGEWYAQNTWVNRYTRVDADKARLKLAVDMPFQAEIDSCSGDSTVVRESASLIGIHLATRAGYPSANFFAEGPLDRPSGL
jgi:hypothetical protein